MSQNLVLKIRTKLGENMKIIKLHDIRLLVQSLPIKEINYMYRIAERNQNIGWNECRLEMLKRLGEIPQKQEGLLKKE